MNEPRLREALHEVTVPGCEEAAARALRVVRARPPLPEEVKRRRFGRRGLQVALAVGLIAALVSPAGAAVRHFVRDAVDDGHRPALPALTELPTSGSLLVDSPLGPWVVRADGSKRLLGSYEESTWSPHGLYVAVTAGHQLAALDPEGEVRWVISRAGQLSGPDWSPDGFRIAYLNGDQLRVVAADGTGDRALVSAAAPVGPAWAAGARHPLSYVDSTDTIHTILVDTGRQLFAVPAPAGTSRLEWSRDGSRLLVVSAAELQLRDPSGDLIWRRQAPPGTTYGAAAISPSGGDVVAVATIRAGSSSELLSYDFAGPPSHLFSGLGQLGEVVYSPDGRWLLLAWRSADQWLFLNPAQPGKVVAISDVSAQFDPGSTSPPPFPSVSGWCCRG